MDQKRFAQVLLYLLEETFESHHGIYLDPGTSLFDTLGTISAAEASRPVGGQCATLAAQVAHITFYLDVLERYMLGQETGEVDWDAIWETIGEVTPDEWASLKAQLKQTYARVSGRMRGFETWDDDKRIGGALGIVVHTAYHLGEIRQALCTLQRTDPTD
jgi:hypothetical protein